MREEVGKVYCETNYSAFKKLSINREVLSGRVNKLVASISKQYIFNPIIVNENMEIIDGQGRYEALKSLGLPIHYIMVPGIGINECIQLNNYNTKWSALDFAKSYASSGNPNYVMLLHTCDTTNLPLSKVLRIANKAKQGRKISGENGYLSPFERGELSFTEDDFLKVRYISILANEIAEALVFTGSKNNAFYYALTIMVDFDEYDHKRMLKNCRKCRSSFALMAKVSDQLAEFERIYNYNVKSIKGRIYFTDYMRNKGYNSQSYVFSHSAYKDKDISSLKEVNE